MGGRASRPLFFGGEKHVSNHRGPTADAHMKSNLIMLRRARELRELLAAEVLRAYRKGWKNIGPDCRRSRTAIARALIRSGAVKGVGTEGTLVQVLEHLARKRLVVLPPKIKKRRPTRK